MIESRLVCRACGAIAHAGLARPVPFANESNRDHSLAEAAAITDAIHVQTHISMEKKHILLLIGAALIVIGLWLATPSFVASHHSKLDEQGQFGDLYGSVNALFSGLALLGVVAAIFLQQKELSLSTKELRNSANALRKQVELSADAARIQVLPELIQMQKVRIKTITREDMASTDLSDESLRTKMKANRQRIDQLKVEIDGLEQWLKEGRGDNHALTRQIGMKRGEMNPLTEAQPELERLLAYQIDLVRLYEKVGSTKLDSAVD